MNVPGSLSISPLNPASGQELGLRPFQRVTAQILNVTGTTAILSIEGYPVVAQLASSDQAAALLAQKTAQFIVSQLSDQMVTLKFVRNDQPQTGSGMAAGQELAAKILEQNGIPVTETSLAVARSALKQHLSVTADLLTELLGALKDYGAWGDGEVDLAAAMKAAGLPVTAESLALAARQKMQTGETLGNLISLLNDASKQRLSADTQKQLSSSLNMLKEMVMQWDGDAQKLAKQLRDSVNLLGKSLENELLNLAQNPNANPAEKSLLSLAKLQQMLQQEGKQDLAKALEKFLGDIRQNQFMNIKPDPVPGRGAWSEVGFLLERIKQDNEQEYPTARLRVAHEGGPNAGKINPAYTRLILQVDINPEETVEVDISLVNKQLKTSMTAPDPNWVKTAQEELPNLEETLKLMGYTIHDMQVGVGFPRTFENISLPNGGTIPMTVDIEV